MTSLDEQVGVITETNRTARMRDGAHLSADIFRPKVQTPVPALLVRTPYNKAEAAARYLPFVPIGGYGLVVQDVRGRFASEGVFEQDVNDAWGERQDGYDSVEWVAGLDWCDGRVTVTGLSAPGIMAGLLMPTRPPHLTAGYLEVAGGAFDNYLYRWYHGGVFRYRVLEWLLTSMGPDVVSKEVSDASERARILALLDELLSDPNQMLEAFRSLPLAPPPVVGHLEAPGFEFWNDYLDNQTRTSYWKNVSLRGRADVVGVPVMHVTGWFDVMLQGTVDMFTELQDHGAPGARGRQRIIIGPWTHGGLWQAKAGELEFPGADVSFGEHLLGYLDAAHGREQVPDETRPVVIYVMGDNSWRSEREWPLARTVYTRYYLRDGAGGAPIDSLNGNKLLSTTAPQGDERADIYQYDPANPIPTIGGRTNDAVKGGSVDQRETERRSVTYATPPLQEDLEVTGPVKAVLYASSSAPDTDWFVKLTDVYPDGRSMFVAHGIIRARYRDSWEQEELIVPGATYRYDIDLWATSQVFRSGHCIRVTVTSSDFPAYERNLNTGADNHRTTAMQVALQTVYHDHARPSHIVLPVIPRG